MQASVNVPAEVLALAAALEGIVAVDMLCLRRARDLNVPYPPLYQSGVRYKREPSTENWLTVPQIMKQRWGDCEDLSCWRVAELRVAGEAASILVVRPGPRLFHVQVCREDGRTEDPSRVLGMRPPRRKRA